MSQQDPHSPINEPLPVLSYSTPRNFRKYERDFSSIRIVPKFAILSGVGTIVGIVITDFWLKLPSELDFPGWTARVCRLFIEGGVVALVTGVISTMSCLIRLRLSNKKLRSTKTPVFAAALCASLSIPWACEDPVYVSALGFMILLLGSGWVLLREVPDPQ